MGKHSLYVDQFTQQLIQLIRAANYDLGCVSQTPVCWLTNACTTLHRYTLLSCYNWSVMCGLLKNHRSQQITTDTA